MTQTQALIDRTFAAFQQHFGRGAARLVIAPGRINLIGEHTDYNDGHVLPIAIDRFTAVAGADRDDGRFNVYTANLEDSFSFRPEQVPQNRPAWASYVAGVVAELAAAGQRFRGKDIALFTNIPIGAGVSSSAALEVGVATLIERMDGLELEDGQMVNICRKADHNYVGINSGPMDQFASRACRSGQCGLLDCRSLEMVNHPLPSGIHYLSVYSGIPRALASSEYNQRQAACQRAVEKLKRVDDSVKALRDADLESLRSLKGELDEETFRFARHVITEQRRVFEFVEAASEGNRQEMGSLLREGHKSLSEDYKVSLPVVDEMIGWLYRQSAVIGARLTGAGFGGSLVCLVESLSADIEKLAADFMAEFKDQTPEDPEVRPFASEDGARYQKTILP